jgi:hypothetical protein
MTSSVLIGLFIAAATVLYWMLCRKRSLAVQTRAVDLLSELYADDSVTDKEKQTAHYNYLMTQRWWYLPFLVAVAPFVLAFTLIFNRKGLPKPSDDSPKMREVMDCLVMIYLTRNPITAAVCMTTITLMALPVILVGLLLNRIKSLPSLAMLAVVVSALVATNVIKPSKEARAH